MTKTVKPQALVNPGPGSYQPDTGFDQISKQMQSAKSMNMYGLDKFGISVVKPSTMFASKVQRFNDKSSIEKQRLPGPGSYEAASQVEALRNKRRVVSPNPGGAGPLKPDQLHQVPWNKQHNPPSIPSHDFVFGYEEDNGELVRQRNNDKVHTGVKNDTVGPGEYEIARTIGQSRKGPSWH